MLKYCIDATALIYYIAEKFPVEELKKIMKEIESGKGIGILSVVNLAEFHRGISRIFSEDKADMYVAWLKESKIDIIPPSIEIAT